MTTKAKHKILFQEALDYLAEHADIGSVRRHMDDVEEVKLTSLVDVYTRLLWSLSNRQGMRASIGDVWKLEEVLEGFEPEKVLKRYADWGELFDQIEATVHPPSRMVKSNPWTYWVQFCKGAYFGAIRLAWTLA